MKLLKKIANDLRLSVSDDDVRYKFQYLWLYRILGTVSLFMSIINIFTNKHSLMIATLIFGASCFFDVWLIKRSEKGMRISFFLLGIELTALLSYFLMCPTFFWKKKRESYFFFCPFYTNFLFMVTPWKITPPIYIRGVVSTTLSFIVCCFFYRITLP